MDREEKLQGVKTLLKRHKKPAVLLSGGVDSSLLAYLVRAVIGKNAFYITVRSSLSPTGEEKSAENFARAHDMVHHFLDLDEMDNASFRENSPKRCYICRKLRDEAARTWALERGCDAIMDGMNATDLSDYRPGLIAADEDGIIHPLMEAGFTKEDVRAAARDFGLEVWDRPSEPCLASRFPPGTGLDREGVERVRQAEEALHGLGFREVRVRHFPLKTAVVALPRPEEALPRREQIVREFQAIGFSFVTLDLEGLVSGSLNRLITDR
jgi:uncharacterized protein